MVGFAKIGLRSDAGTGDSPKSTDDSLTDFLRIPRARSKQGSVHAERRFVVAEMGLRSDAARGGLPKPTDDSLTGFLQASPDRLKLGWCTRSGGKQFFVSRVSCNRAFPVPCL